jgi:hypothetical protein
MQHANGVGSGRDQLAYRLGAEHDIAIASGAAVAPFRYRAFIATFRILAALTSVARIARSNGRRTRVAPIEALAVRVRLLHRRESYQTAAARA